MTSKNLNKFGKATIAVVSAAAMGLGGISAASAADPMSSLGNLGGSSSSGSLGGGDLEVPTGERVKLGNVGGPAWNVDVYKQVHGATTVKPGATVKTRIEIQGVKGDTRIDELRERMPEGFKLQKIETVKGGLLGDKVETLKQGDYGTSVDGDMQQVTVAIKEGLLIKTGVKVNPSKPLIIDFTWKAPKEEGVYKTGGGAKVGAAIGKDKNFDDGPEVTVASDAAPEGSAGSSSGELLGS